MVVLALVARERRGAEYKAGGRRQKQNQAWGQKQYKQSPQYRIRGDMHACAAISNSSSNSTQNRARARARPGLELGLEMDQGLDMRSDSS